MFLLRLWPPGPHLPLLASMSPNYLTGQTHGQCPSGHSQSVEHEGISHPLTPGVFQLLTQPRADSGDLPYMFALCSLLGTFLQLVELTAWVGGIGASWVQTLSLVRRKGHQEAIKRRQTQQ